MRVFFSLLYQPMAWSYDLVADFVSWGRWNDWVLSVLPYLNGPNILEIGYGPGHLQIALKRKALRVFGIDASFQMGQQAQRRIQKQDFTPHLICGCAQHLPYPDKIFDQVVATFPTNYIFSEESLRGVYSILKPGGILVVLPTAWITGKQWADRGTALLFRITGQSPDWDSQRLKPFDDQGFQTDLIKVQRESWSVAIILATKPAS
jgi:ubiquinone/menaquinone biosynthesis C-methylase UbiE